MDTRDLYAPICANARTAQESLQEDVSGSGSRFDNEDAITIRDSGYGDASSNVVKSEPRQVKKEHDNALTFYTLLLGPV